MKEQINILDLMTKKEKKKKQKKSMLGNTKNAPSSSAHSKPKVHFRKGNATIPQDRLNDYINAEMMLTSLKHNESEESIFRRYSYKEMEMLCSMLEIKGRSRLHTKRQMYDAIVYHLYSK